MTSIYKTVRGTKDILPEEVVLWQNIEEKARRLFSLYGYREIRTPILEDASLFNRSLGETAEVVQKQMFLINRNDDVLALRPEGTAPIVRAWIENGLDKKERFSKLYYIGPMFRAERPQKGRLRQFHHIGCEAIGSLEADLDIEIISLLDHILRAVGISDFVIKINSLGCSDDKRNLAALLKRALKNERSKLCDDCKERYERNVFRIIDCKVPECRKIVDNLNLDYEDYLCPDCNAHFRRVLDGLADLKARYGIVRQIITSKTLVRGLDYYTRTVFEITHKRLGSQDAIAAGGRYDGLVEDLGGEVRGAIGFALGVERVVLSLAQTQRFPLPPLVKTYLIPLCDEARKRCVVLIYKLRSEGIACDMDYENRSLKANMRKANDIGARFAILIGEEELQKNSVTLKDMQSGLQEIVAVENLSGVVKERLRL